MSVVELGNQNLFLIYDLNSREKTLLVCVMECAGMGVISECMRICHHLMFVASHHQSLGEKWSENVFQYVHK